MHFEWQDVFGRQWYSSTAWITILWSKTSQPSLWWAPFFPGDALQCAFETVETLRETLCEKSAFSWGRTVMAFRVSTGFILQKYEYVRTPNLDKTAHVLPSGPPSLLKSSGAHNWHFLGSPFHFWEWQGLVSFNDIEKTSPTTVGERGTPYTGALQKTQLLTKMEFEMEPVFTQKHC